MIGNAVLAGAAKVAAVGVLMAAGAGGIYLVASTNDDSTDRQQVVAETATAASPIDATPEETATVAGEVLPAKSTETPIAPNEPTEFSKPMLTGGWTWVDAKPRAGMVEARIDDVVCATAASSSLGEGLPPFFQMEVPSDAQKPGCGSAGSVVSFYLDGGRLDQSVPFREGIVNATIFSSGPPFSVVMGSYETQPSDEPVQFSVVPEVDGKVCGYDLKVGSGGFTPRGFVAVVFSDEAEEGCGAPGRGVTLRVFAVEDDGSRTRTEFNVGSVAWQPGETVKVADVVTLPSVVGE